MFLCARFIIYTLNFLYFVVGAATFGLGVWFILNYEKFIDYPDYTSLAILMFTAAGAVLAMGTILGSWGTFSENSFLIIMYGISLAAIINLQGYIIYECFALDETELEQDLRLALKLRFTVGENNNAYHFFEKTFQCCGIERVAYDYLIDYIPEACCTKDWKDNQCEMDNLRPPCVPVVKGVIVHYAHLLAYGLFGSCILQVLLIIGSSCMPFSNHCDHK